MAVFTRSSNWWGQVKLPGSAVARATKSLRDLRIAEITKLDMTIDNGKVVSYRARVSLSFKYQGS